MYSSPLCNLREPLVIRFIIPTRRIIAKIQDDALNAEQLRIQACNTLLFRKAKQLVQFFEGKHIEVVQLPNYNEIEVTVRLPKPPPSRGRYLSPIKEEPLEESDFEE